MSSINAATIGTLVNAITGGLTSGQTYDLMRKISEDLDDVFSTVNSGPLKAVDASALIHINPANIDSPGDVSPRVTSQGQVAFLNVANIFKFDQRINKTTEGTWDSANSHVGDVAGIGGTTAYLGANLKFKNGAWGSDIGGVGSMFFLNAGAAVIFHWNGAALVQRFYIDVNGVIQCGTPLTLTNAVGGDIVLEKQKDIRSSNNAATAALSLIRLDANDLVGLGSDAANTGKGHVAIAQVAAGNLPAAGATKDGIIVQDKTNNRFCFYQNGLRYYVLGTAF